MLLKYTVLCICVPLWKAKLKNTYYILQGYTNYISEAAATSTSEPSFILPCLSIASEEGLNEEGRKEQRT
jgi:hypothetical protein